MAANDNYQLLIHKLDQFIRKYYLNRLVRGSLYSVGLILGAFLASSLLEYFFYFDTTGRKALFFSFLGLSFVSLGYWVFNPLFRYFRLGKAISHEQAAVIIGQHFGDVKDKLLNILQLKLQSDQLTDKELILASIDQKSEEIRPVPFQAAINLTQNRRYLRYALPPLMILLVLLLAAPSVIRESTHRLIYNSKEFFRPAPFSFELGTEQLKAIQYEDFTLKVRVEGEQLPNEAFIEIDNYQYRLTKEGPDAFSYVFNNVQDDISFRFYAAGVESRKYILNVLRKPNLASFEVKLNYPDYTGRKDEAFDNIGDLIVPEGTQINWVFNARYTEGIRLKFSRSNSELTAKRFGDDLFSFARKAQADELYRLFFFNQDIPKGDSVSYSITVIPDQYPSIQAERFVDSTNTRVQFFVGESADDYGIRSITFNYRLKKSGKNQGDLVTLPLSRPNSKQTSFEHTFDLRELGLEPGDEVSYYFEVFDNDAVNGSKSSRTNILVYAMPTVKEFEQMAEKNDKEIKDNLKNALAESRKIQDQMKKMRDKLLQEKELSWQNRKEIEKLLNRQKELQEQIEKAKDSFEKNQENQDLFSETDEELQQKQEQLQKLFEEAMDEDMQKLMQQLEELLQKMEKEEALEMMEKFQSRDEQTEMELDRLLELFKQLELEQELKNAMDKLEELAKEQEQLSDETSKSKESQEDLKEKQEEIDKQFQEFKEQMEQIEKKNEQLENQKDLGNPQEEMKDIQRDINESKMNLQQNKNSKASQSQKNASQKMKDMANNMNMKMQSGQMEQMMEDMQALRQLLENLVGLSFDQEDLIKNLDKTEINTPRYTELVEEQFKLKDDFGLVEDSLQALAKRVFQIESFVTGKVGDIKDNMRLSLDDLEERRKFQAADHQQRAMTNINDLALMLSEVMNQMQQQMSMMMSGSQMCNKPNNSGQPQDKMSQGQEKLNGEMRQMRGQMQQGDNPSSKEFAQMAARQAALRKALEEKQRKMREQGKGGSKELQELIDQMDKVEIDLVNKRMTNDMLKRQQDILTRLLEHEKAERQQEYDEKRKSETAQETQRRMPPELEEYIRKRKAEIEQYKTVSPALKPYYKSLVEDYFKSLKGNAAPSR
ncbi:MAG: DUF4175 domain-containing protein [Haliscomenobacter sp.]|nr:DUF4175 domain-containing protein [Haliscomenobacter sp.]